MRLGGQDFSLNLTRGAAFTVDVDPTVEPTPITTVDLDDFPFLRRLGGVTELQEQIAVLDANDPNDPTRAELKARLDIKLAKLSEAIAGDPATALALEDRTLDQGPTLALITAGVGPQRLATPVVFFDRAEGVPEAVRTDVQLRRGSTRRGERVHYGWGRKPGEPCVKLAELPRWCLAQRNVVDPNLPDFWIEFDLIKQLAVSSTRLRLFGMGLTKAQIDEAEAYFDAAGFDLIRFAKGVKFRPAIEANRSSLPSSRAVQQLAHEVYGGDFIPPDLSNEHLLKVLFKGMRPCWPEPTSDGPTVRLHFSRFEKRDPAGPGGYELPDVEVVLDEAKASLRRIRYRFDRLAAWTTVEAEDGAHPWTAWGHAKRLAHLASFIVGQYEGHVASHLLLESLQVALARVEVSDELHEFFEPFVRGVAEVNNYGNGLIVGADGILCRGTGLTPKGALDYAAWAVGQHDWRGFTPRERTAGRDEHDFSKSARAFWEFAKDLVRRNMPSFSVHKESYRRLVNEVVTNSVPCTAQDRARFDPAVRSEVSNPANDPRRPTVNGTSRALSTIDFEAEGASEDVVDFLTFFVYHASFLHTHANDQQRDIGGDLRVCPMSVRRRGVPGSEDEFWADYAPRASEAAMQLFLVDVLSRVDTARLITQGILSLFVSDRVRRVSEEIQAALKASGVDLERVRRAPTI